VAGLAAEHVHVRDRLVVESVDLAHELGLDLAHELGLDLAHELGLDALFPVCLGRWGLDLRGCLRRAFEKALRGCAVALETHLEALGPIAARLRHAHGFALGAKQLFPGFEQQLHLDRRAAFDRPCVDEHDAFHRDRPSLGAKQLRFARVRPDDSQNHGI